MNGNQLFQHVTGIINTRLCLLVWLMHKLPFRLWWTRVCGNFWPPEWLYTSTIFLSTAIELRNTLYLFERFYQGSVKIRWQAARRKACLMQKWWTFGICCANTYHDHEWEQGWIWHVWRAAALVKDIQILLWFANLYRMLIKYFTASCTQITNFLKGYPKKFIWAEEPQEAFDDLKRCFISAQTNPMWFLPRTWNRGGNSHHPLVRYRLG